MSEIKGTYTIDRRLVGKDRIPTLSFYHEHEEPMRAVVCLHGWTGSKEGMLAHCLRMADAGFYSISVDARMHGERIDPQFWGKFAENFPHTFFTIVTDTAKDICQVVDSLETRPTVDSNRIGLMGVSMGGFVTLVATTLEKRIRASASVIGAANFPLFVERMVSLKVLPFKEKPMIKPDEETRKLYKTYDPLNNPEKFPPTALFLIGGSLDPFIPREGITELYEALKPHYGAHQHQLKMKLYEVAHAYTSEMETEVIRWFKTKL